MSRNGNILHLYFKKTLCVVVGARIHKNYGESLIIKGDVYAILFGVATFYASEKFSLIRPERVVDYYIERGNFVI